jgi:hypothetical protein
MMDRMSFRTVARQLGLPRFLLQLRALRQTGAHAIVNRSLVRSYVLPKIRKAPPIAAGAGPLEVHMLLHKARVWEGAWALYSLLHYAGEPLRVVIHDDGTLDKGCAGILSGLFPGIRIIPRKEADDVVNAKLERQGLKHCLALRRTYYVHFLKLIDPFVFAGTPAYIVIDSDILTFSQPSELLDLGFGAGGGTTPHLYSPDRVDSLVRTPEALCAAGLPPVRKLNCGLVRIQRGGFSLEHVDQMIAKLDILNRESIHFFTEQTLYACEMACHGAVRLDPERYTICGDPHDSKIVTGHYCGDYYGKTRFYREAIPCLVGKLPIQ